MKDKKLLKEFRKIEKILEQVEEKIITGVRGLPTPEYHKNAEWLLDRDLRYKLFEKHPECFIPIRGYGYEIPIFCVCNRTGALDPFMVDFSLKLARRMSKSVVLPVEQIRVAKIRLEELKKQLEG